MTVDDISSDIHGDNVSTCWFRDGLVIRHCFSLDSLELANSQEATHAQ